MNILVTGATGFIGKHLVRELNRTHCVHILVRSTSQWGDLGVEHCVEFNGDIEFLANYLKANAIEGIIHLASLYIAEHKPSQIKELLMSNIYLGTALLEAAKIAGIRWFLNTGTIWQNYNSPDYADEYNPVNLYAATKQAFITMAKYYTETSPLRFVTLKLCDTFGPDDTRRKIFSLFDDISKSGAPLDMSPGEQRMDILHIDDVVSGFIHLVNLLHSRQNKRDEYVLSSGKQVSLRELAGIYSFNNQVRLNINWGGRSYRQREVMRPYIGNVLEGWRALNIVHLIKRGGNAVAIKKLCASSYNREAA